MILTAMTTIIMTKNNNKHITIIALLCRQGDEWYRQRSAVSKHLLKLQGVAEFCLPIEQVSEELTSKLGILKNDNGIVNGLENEVFKWAMECKIMFMTNSSLLCLCIH